MVKTERSVSNKVILDIFSKAYFVSISSPKVFVYALLFIIKLKGMCYTNFHFHSPLSIANFLSLSKLMFIISRFDATANSFVISLLLTTQNLPSLKRMRPFSIHSSDSDAIRVFLPFLFFGIHWMCSISLHLPWGGNPPFLSVVVLMLTPLRYCS